MLSNTRHSLIAASVLGIAGLAAAFPAYAQSTDQKMRTAFSACQKEADKAVPVRDTTQQEMNHYVVFSSCLEKRGFNIGTITAEEHR
jgi:hypothetical protein